MGRAQDRTVVSRRARLAQAAGAPQEREKKRNAAERRQHADRDLLPREDGPRGKICQDEEDLIDQIQITVRHEIGHYLGLDEDDLERLGLA